ncbi:uncharacterized protein LOC132171798 [Corylus avellana]|uniref:uncharacterized protein LOC132171798 n=1 Tax=Corylus avellana TaxID=13451 RepID=UPI00286A7957|nr:uncharacterized protein LOC132171798 [Corylus avellana]
MERVRCKFGFSNMLVVDCVGKRGGLALLWKDEIGVEIQNFSCRHINASICHSPDGRQWKFTGFYGHPEAEKRKEAWGLLRFLTSLDPLPWVCMGDFNEILYQSEKRGGNVRNRRLMEDFQATLAFCELMDLGFRGPKFTWNNGRDGEDFIQERLDRVVANDGWCGLFPKADVLVEGAVNSDHLPIFVMLHEEQQLGRKRRRFKHEAHWVLDRAYSDVVKYAWRANEGWEGSWDELQCKMGRCQVELNKWQQRNKGPENDIKNLCHQLIELQAQEGPYEKVGIDRLKEKIHNHMEQEEVHWQQRSRVEWLRNGDKNTKFFHASANQRRNSNKIRLVHDMEGNPRESQEDIGKAFVEYFTTLFSTGQPRRMEECLEFMERRISDEMNERLLRPFMEEDVETAIHQMAPLKAPGPDGFNACFFQKNWAIVGPEGRLITDNIIAAYETLRTMHSRMYDKSGFMAVKLDMSKAYDRVEWNFLEAVMRRMGFAERWINLIMIANPNQWNRMNGILQLYEDASGQKLNTNKMAIFFSRNTSNDEKEAILRLAAIPETQRYDSYLGLPAVVGKSRTKEFRTIIDRVAKRLQDWKLKFLSQAGKEILLKAVVQAIPTYSMRVFMLPKALCGNINSLMQKFWWGHKSNDSRIHWMSWGRLGSIKEKGGMGFREFSCFNKALLAKQYWRLWKTPDSLVARIMKAKYFPNCEALDASMGSKPSYVWRSILSSKELLKEGLMWRIGDGDIARIWGERWLSNPNRILFQSLQNQVFAEAKVSDLINKEMGVWDVNILNTFFREEEVRAIQSIPLNSTPQADKLIWGETKNGLFSVKSAYHLAKELEDRSKAECSTGMYRSEVWKMIWKLKVPNVEKVFLWRACHDILPTKENLMRRKIVADSWCPVYGLEPETIEEVLLRGREEDIKLFAGLSRQLWLRRNMLLHEGVFIHPNMLVQRVVNGVADFGKAMGREYHEGEPTGSMDVEKWKAPPTGCLKVNWDAALNLTGGRMGMGVVIRDHEGCVRAVKCSLKQGSFDPAAAETMAAIHALKFCMAQGMLNIHMEGDAKNVVDALNSREENWSRTGHLVDEARNLLNGFNI